MTDTNQHSVFDLGSARQRDRSHMSRGDMSIALDAAYNEIARLYEQLEALEQKSERQATNIGALYRQRVAVQEQLEAAEAALREYADTDNWEADNDAPFLGTWIKTTDPREIARAALTSNPAKRDADG